MISEKIIPSGTLQISHYDSEMNLIKQYDLKNLIVNSGKNWLMSRAIGNTPPVMSHMALGTGTNISVLTNTGLQLQTGSKKAIDSATQVDNQITYVCTFGPGLPATDTPELTEAGLFNGATDSSIMFSRVKFSPINKADADTLIINWTIVLS